MTGRDEGDDAAWRAIVENYGERPELEEPEARPTAYAARHEPEPQPELEPELAEDPEDRFVPPEPPPLPQPPPARLAAWSGLFGAPAVLLVAVVLGIALPEWLAYALVAAFVGGFGYLVLHMNHEPRDPWDNGAQV